MTCNLMGKPHGTKPLKHTIYGYPINFRPSFEPVPDIMMRQSPAFTYKHSKNMNPCDGNGSTALTQNYLGFVNKMLSNTNFTYQLGFL